MAELSRDLRFNLGKAFLQGFLDYSAQSVVEDTDTIPGGIGLTLIEMADKCIDQAETRLAALFLESPQLTLDTVYAAGADCAKIIEELGPRPISLN